MSKSKPFRVGYCLASLVLMIIASPFIEEFPGGPLIQAILLTIVFLSAVFALGGRGPMLVLAIVLVAPTLVARWASYSRPDLVSPEVFRGTGMLFLGFVILQFLRFILRAPRVDSEVLCASVAVYLMLGLLWSLLYSLIDWFIPDSFVFNVGPASEHSMQDFQALYFSFITLSTIGYGDIVPVSKVARMLAIVEAVFGMFYVTLLIARLVSLYSSSRGNDKPSGEELMGKNKETRRP
jgi:voltage-gated potassium channel